MYYTLTRSRNSNACTLFCDLPQIKRNFQLHSINPKTCVDDVQTLAYKTAQAADLGCSSPFLIHAFEFTFIQIHANHIYIIICMRDCDQSENKASPVYCLRSSVLSSCRYSRPLQNKMTVVTGATKVDDLSY